MRVLVVDDEPLARDRLVRLLNRHAGVAVVGACADGKSAIDAIRSERPDVVLLDVQMPDLDGFGVLASLAPTEIPLVLFVTAHDRYAVNAFDVHAFDYLLKPVDPRRLAEAVERAAVALSERRDESRLVALLESLKLHQPAAEHAAPTPATPATEPLEWLTLPTTDGMRLVRASEVDFVESSGNYVRVNLGKQQYLLRASIGALAERLDPRWFRRCHRGVIVNLARVAELRRWFSGEYLIVLKDGRKLKLSRHYRDAFLEDLRLGATLE